MPAQQSQSQQPTLDSTARKPRVVDPYAKLDNSLPQRVPRPAPLPTRPQDIRQTKEYKAAARKWLSTIVALPVLFVTSYMLYERTYGNKSQKHLGRPDVKPAGMSENNTNE